MAYGEQRINLLGWLRGQVVYMTYTKLGGQFACNLPARGNQT